MRSDDLSAAEYELLARIAHRYYTDGRTQEEIAREFGLSRPKVQRLLERARWSGVVDIRIAAPPWLNLDLATRLREEFRLIIRRVMPTPGSQLALQGIGYTYHAFITDREGPPLDLEADHRRHAEIENTIRDVKYGMALNHMPSGRFAANAAWLEFNAIAHNLARWITRLGLGETLLTTKTVRTRFIALPGRLARRGRRLHLHLPANWPWQDAFLAARERLASLVVPATTPA
jgi:hypothetical protein